MPRAAVSVVVLGLIVAARWAWGTRAWPAVIGLLTVYLVIILLTGDPPGPARRRGEHRDPTR